MIKIIIVAVIFYSSTLFSQVKIVGKVVSYKNSPIEFAEVLLISQDSIAIKSELTTKDGEFTVLIKEGNYTLQVRELGKVLWTQKISVIQNLNLGVIEISEPQQKLTEVVVTSQKKLIERKVDRLVFNIENSIAATGGDALDALKVTPGIRVQNDQIAMIGKSDMAVMIDDRLIQLSGDNLISLLKTISSDNIQNIEVITTPPSKYDAQGNSGLVNIKLKKIKKNSWNSSVRSSYTQTSYPAGSVGGSFSYDKNKIAVDSDIGYTNGSIRPTYETIFFYPNQTWRENNVNRNYYNLVKGKLSINYKFSKKFNMSIQYMSSNNDKKNRENDVSIIENNVFDTVDSLIIAKAKNKIKNSFNTIDVYSVYNLDTIGKKITINFNYLNFKDSQDRVFSSNNLLNNNVIIPDSYYSANNVSNQQIKNYSAKIDFELPVKFIELSFGGKVSFTKNNNDLEFYDLTPGNSIFDPLQSNKFIYEENTEAAYISGSKKLSEKWETQLGFRLETTQTKGNSITLTKINNNRYTNLFPTFYLSYTPNDNNLFSLNYGKRLDRPGFEYLNPFRIYNNKYQYLEGNPFLQPSYSHNLEFNYTHKNNWNSKFYYTKIVDGIGGIVFINQLENSQANIILNYLNVENIGISESYTLSFGKWFQSYNSFDVFYSDSKSTVTYTNSNSKGTNANITTDNTFFFNKAKTILLGLNYSYNFKGVSGIDNISAYNQLDVSIKLLFLNKTLSLTVIGNDILKSGIYTQTSMTNNYQIKYKNYEDMRFFRFSILYKFGKKSTKTNQIESGNEEEKKRLKK